ncbi:MAG: hypothetical protein LBS89_04495 [Zoogloeaceae bacterium]|jgi:hypothetical protein|nr:hypothetical protein [Zoogloeaceae bacterium]
MINIKIIIGVIALQFILPSLTFGAENEHGVIKEKQGELSCGNAIVKSRTIYLDRPDDFRQVIEQDITVTYNNRTMKLRLDSRNVDKPTFGRVLLDSYVYGWSCLESIKKQNYIFLWYVCTSMDENGFCESRQKEWLRIFHENGNPVAASYQRHDKRYNKLLRNIGLSQALKNVKSEDVD